MALCFLLIKSIDIGLKAERINDATVVLITLIYSMAIALNYSVLQCQQFSILLRDSIVNRSVPECKNVSIHIIFEHFSLCNEKIIACSTWQN